MRAQEKAIIAAVSNRVFEMGARFLTLADLLECVGHVSELVGGDPKRLSRHTVQAWVRDGVFGPGDENREIRNRLYCGEDVIRLSAIYHATHVGLSTHVAIGFADMLEEQSKVYFGTWKTSPSTKRSFDPRDFVIASTVDGQFEFYEPSPEDTEDALSKTFALRMMSAGLGVVLNARTIWEFATAVTIEKWKQKALKLRDKIHTGA